MDGHVRLNHNEENREADRIDLAIRGDGSDTAGHAVRDIYGRQVAAITEGFGPDFGHALGDDHAFQVVALPEGPLPDALEALKANSYKQWRVVMARISEEKPVPYKELTAELGVNTTRVNTLKNKGVEFLRKYMGNDEELKSLIRAFEE